MPKQNVCFATHKQVFGLCIRIRGIFDSFLLSFSAFSRARIKIHTHINDFRNVAAQSKMLDENQFFDIVGQQAQVPHGWCGRDHRVVVVASLPVGRSAIVRRNV